MLRVKRSLFFIGYWLLSLQVIAQAPPIGSWRAHHSYAGTLQVVKGDKILVLEAMKMENAIKSPTDGIIADVFAKQGLAVDKNQILITFK